MKLWLPLSLLSGALMISSCASPAPYAKPTSTVAIDPKAACLVWQPIIFSRLHDTAETLAQVKRLNAAHDAYCGVKP